jgi:hypothetical protein
MKVSRTFHLEKREEPMICPALQVCQTAEVTVPITGWLAAINVG